MQFLKIARVVAESSSCISLKVGALLVRDNRIISSGYNGTPPGFSNCNTVHSCSGPEHSEWSQNHEIHAEMNAILYAATSGVSITNTALYCTHEPCNNCLKHILGTGPDGIKSVIYQTPYTKQTAEQLDWKRKMLEAYDYPFLRLVQSSQGTALENHPICELWSDFA